MTRGDSHVDPFLPPDQAQRDRILHDLDKNILVEAAAGTGKTTSMVARMVELLKTGTCGDVRKMAAVTFTRKAAAELRSRFQVELEKAVRTATGDRHARLMDAVRNIEQCFIGTIHSFCARILGERPVEAGVDLAFQGLDEEQDAVLRNEAWERFTAYVLVNNPDGIQDDLNDVDIRLSDLRDAFIRFAGYADVDVWPVPNDPTPPDITGAVRAIDDYVERIRAMSDCFPDDSGTDKLIPLYKKLHRVVQYYDYHADRLEFFRLLSHFDVSATVVQKIWADNNIFPGLDPKQQKKRAKEEKETWDAFRDNTVRPLMTAWREYRYPVAIRALKSATAYYDAIRRERGVLNYQDLLMKTAALLRDNPHVRGYFSRRYTHLLVDEFQDTDPIQAEMMLLMTADDVTETDWRACRPRPGSLFVVGDPKQSIYRFRRADIVSYSTVKHIITYGEDTDDDSTDSVGKAGHDAGTATLSTNFRSTERIIEWVNTVFGGMFPESATEHAPEYVKLDAGRRDVIDGDLHGIYTLNIPKEFSKSQSVACEYEADRIARYIRSAIDNQWTVNRRSDAPAPVSPGDFMIITYTTKRMAIYAGALEKYGIPCRMTGGSALKDVTELTLLYQCLKAVVQPDDPIALLAVLRGELFGISDAELYAFKQAGGEFNFNKRVPADFSGTGADRMRDAFSRLKRYARWLAKYPPVAAIEKILMDLGLIVSAAGHDGGDVRAGSLAKAVELIRGAQGQTWSVMELVESLERIVNGEETHDGLSVLSRDVPAVRIMNLHKVKGLEAPVVFLADPFGNSKHPPEIRIDRSGDTVAGYIEIRVSGRFQNAQHPIAQPPDWENHQRLEREFSDAEKKRLWYVAATRAGAMLVISRKASKKNDAVNPWGCFMPFLDDAADLPETTGDVAVAVQRSGRIDAGEPEGAVAAVTDRFHAVATPTYAAYPAKWFALDYHRTGSDSVGDRDGNFPAPMTTQAEAASDGAAARDVPAGEYGVEWGTVIHHLLECVMRNPDMDILKAAADLLSESELDPTHAPAAVEVVEAVIGSDIWRRAGAARQRYSEIPFQVMADAVQAEGVGLPTVLRGAIDLVFRESAGWVIVDYKTDRVSDGAAMKRLAAHYAPQLHLYARAWERATGESVSETGVFFTRTGEYVKRAFESNFPG